MQTVDWGKHQHLKKFPIHVIHNGINVELVLCHKGKKVKVTHRPTRLPSLVKRGTMGVNSLPKTVTRQRRDCNLNPGPSAPESSTLTTRLPSHPDTSCERSASL